MSAIFHLRRQAGPYPKTVRLPSLWRAVNVLFWIVAVETAILAALILIWVLDHA